MAAKLDPRHTDRTRAKIRTTALLNRLQGCALGEVEMTSQQIRATEIVLRKSLPDLQGIHTTTDDDGRSYESWIAEIQEINQRATGIS